ncbi:MAG: dTDP-4-dehydrorhamnose 3,5-epimerase family protein [Candidatus Shapirobacteria bacterium]
MVKLTSEVKKLLTKQDYSFLKTISGVLVLEIKRFTGEDGVFSEIIRAKNCKVSNPSELKGFEIRQINYGEVVPGTLKAWHLHFKQDEIWFIHPSFQVIVGFLDLRQESETKNNKMRLSLGNGRAHLVYVPRGVAHGLANPYKNTASMTYLVNNWFDGSDEYRLPPDFYTEKDFWKIKSG